MVSSPTDSARPVVSPVAAMAARVWALLRRSLGLLVLLGVGLAVARARLWAPLRVEVARVDRATVTAVAFGRGTVESQREAAVGFDMVGRLRAVLVDEGDRVTLGQELAQLETDQAQADLRSAQRNIAAARASLTRLAAEEARARTQIAAAAREEARTRALAAQGAVADVQRDEAADRLRLARSDLDRVLAQRAEATRGIDVAAGGAEQRRVAMVRQTLLAPFEGLVLRRLREPGDTVTVGATVLRLVDTAQVYVRAALDETVLPQLALDQPVTVTFPGDDTPVAARVTRIPWESDRQTHELLVEVTPTQLTRRVAIGQRADVRVALARRDGVLRVPTRMLHRDEAGVWVYADRGGRIAVVRPRLGLSGEDHVEVLDGLHEGDTLLGPTQPGATLSPGRRWTAR